MKLSNARPPRIALRLALAALAGASSLLLASCRTPQSLCDEWYAEVVATRDVCAPELTNEALALAVEPVDGMNPTRHGCGYVSSVSDPQELVNDCFPILRSLQAMCAGDEETDPRYSEFREEFPENLPGSCSSGHFEVGR